MNEPNQYVDELFRDIYFVEHERKDAINVNLSIPIGVMTVIAGVVIYLGQSVYPWCSSWPFFLFASFYLIITFCTILTIYYSVRGLVNFTYGYISSAKGLRTYIDELRTYHESVDDPDIDAKIEEELRSFLTGEFTRLAEQNWQNNVRKLKFLRKTNQWMIITLVMLIPAMVAYYNLQVLDPCGSRHRQSTTQVENYGNTDLQTIELGKQPATDPASKHAG